MLAYVWLYPPPQSETKAREQEEAKEGSLASILPWQGEGTATQMSSMRCKFNLETHFSSFQLNEIPQF